jgi:hypothetical protein
MGDKLVKHTDEENFYKFNRQQFNLVLYGITIAWFDLIISEDIPVNDFDVNKLAYQISNENNFLTAYYGKGSPESIEASIIRKECILLPEYADLATDSSSFAQVVRTRIDKRYIGRGWTIRYNDKQIKSSNDLFSLKNHKNTDPLSKTGPSKCPSFR